MAGRKDALRIPMRGHAAHLIVLADGRHEDDHRDVVKQRQPVAALAALPPHVKHLEGLVLDEEIAAHDATRAHACVERVVDRWQIVACRHAHEVVQKVLDSVAQLKLGAAGEALANDWVRPQGGDAARRKGEQSRCGDEGRLAGGGVRSARRGPGSRTSAPSPG